MVIKTYTALPLLKKNGIALRVLISIIASYKDRIANKFHLKGQHWSIGSGCLESCGGRYLGTRLSEEKCCHRLTMSAMRQGWGGLTASSLPMILKP